MKKIVPRLLVISSQILIGALFLIFTINSKNESKFTVDSKEIEKLSKFVYEEKSSNVEIDKTNESFIDDKLLEEDGLVTNDIEENVDIEVKKDDIFFMEREVINTYNGILTGYGPDCYGCGNFVTNKVSTASGYHIANIVDGIIQPAFTITYNDNEFGEVRIVAADSSIPYNSIVRITIPYQDPIIAIVLDRGSTVGFENCKSSNGCLTTFDLLFATESSAMSKTYNVTFDVLRIGA